MRGSRRGLSRERLRADRRRDRRDAGHLHAAGLRSGRLHRRLRGRGRDPRRRSRARRATCWSASRAADCTPTAISLARRIVAERMNLGVSDPLSRRGSLGGGRAAARSIARISRRCDRCSPTAPSTRWRTSPAAALPGNLNRALPPTLDAEVDVRSWTVPECFPAARSEPAGSRSPRCSERSTWASEWW